MSVLVPPNTLTPGTFEDVGDAQENFDAIQALVNGGLDGANLLPVTADQLSVSSTNNLRRGAGSVVGLSVPVGSAYTLIMRAPTVVMPVSGVLHISALAITVVASGTAQSISFAIRLNGVTARSRFGVAPASGVSSGLMEITGLAVTSFGSPTGAALYTDTVDSGLSALVSTNGVATGITTQPTGVFVPVSVAAGSYVVDFVARVDTGTSLAFTEGSLRVKTEAF